MDNPMLNELAAVRDDLDRLRRRVDGLERKIREGAVGTSTVGTATSCAPEPPSPVKPATQRWDAPPSSQASEAPKRPASSPGLETVIGRYWLNRIGIVTLVLGVAFFILYTFQYFGPLMKVSTGLALAVALVAGGTRLERTPSLQWYGRGLAGGGWALLYFTVYAMHHIPAVRLIGNAAVDLVLLAAVAAGTVGQSLRYRSEAATGLALSLGFLTICISDIGFFTLAASAMLVAALSWLVGRLGWHRMYQWGVVASSVIYAGWIRPCILESRWREGLSADGSFWLQVGFLLVHWSLYHLAAFAFDERNQSARRAAMLATLLNGAVFVGWMLVAMESFSRLSQGLVVAAVGVAYLASAWAARLRQRESLSTLLRVLGWSLASLAVPIATTAHATSVLWTAELAVFVWAGLRYESWSARLFACGLAAATFLRLLVVDLGSVETIALLGRSVPWRVVIGALGTVSFGMAAAWYRRLGPRVRLRPFEAEGFHAYFLAASLLAWLLAASELKGPWLSVGWSMLAAAAVGLGCGMRDRLIRLVGACGFLGVGVLLAVDLVLGPVLSVRAGLAGGNQWQLMAIPWVVGALYGMHALYRVPGYVDDDERRLAFAYALAASAVLTCWLWVEVSQPWLSLAWAVEALALVAVGLRVCDAPLRISGLAVFGVLMLKILCADLAGAETWYRVLSFLVAGALLLVASYAYALFAARRDESREPPEPPAPEAGPPS